MSTYHTNYSILLVNITIERAWEVAQGTFIQQTILGYNDEGLGGEFWYGLAIHIRLYIYLPPPFPLHSKTSF